MSANKFKAEFILFNNNELTSYQINQRNKLLHEDMINILTNIITKYPEYKLETNTDLSIRLLYSVNIKLSMNLENNDNIKSIVFEQVDDISLYSFEELKKLLKKIKKQIEKYLNKEIDLSISMLMNDLNSDSEEKPNMARIMASVTNINYII